MENTLRKDEAVAHGAYRGPLDDVHEELVLVLDFGSQTAQLIARRVREQSVFSRLVRHDLPADRIRELNPKGLILSGGPASVYGPEAPLPDPAIFELGIPILGICYGMQVACRAMGGEVTAAPAREFGKAVCRLQQSSELFEGLPPEFAVWMSHGDQVQGLSEAFVSLAATETCHFAAVRHRLKPIFGLQFHPEVTHTEYGSRILDNFVKRICGCRGTWQIGSLIEHQIEAIRRRVGQARVICGLSGGVDSSVVAALLYRAVGSQLSCIFVNNGLLRKGEAEEVEQRFTRHFQTDLHVVDASRRFLDELRGVADPQEKRRIIG
ncbi:MAG TPA: glutamine-hydrolyzing GMP synthase, partial [Planctomycetaceae bacterium]|nr:glutamine-hydrolyzing GMP synthase [Planctomycetaceae bacterium]